MINTENTHAQNLEINANVKTQIEGGADNFDLDVSQCINSLVNQVALYRGVDMTVARKIVTSYLDVEK